MATSLSIRSVSPGAPTCTVSSVIRPLRCSTVRCRRVRLVGRRGGVPEVDTGVDRAHLQVEALALAGPGRLLQMAGAGPLLPPDLRREHRALRIERKPFEVAAVPVDAGLHPDLRRMVLRGDLDTQHADPAVGHARAAHRLQPCPPALDVLEDGGPGQKPVPQVQAAVVGDDRAGVHVEADPADEDRGVHPVRAVDQVDHRDVMAVVHTRQERARQRPQVALLQAPPGAEPAVPHREQGLVEVRPLPVEA